MAKTKITRPVVGGLYRAAYLRDTYFEVLEYDGRIVRTNRYDITKSNIRVSRIDYLDTGFSDHFKPVEGDERSDFELKLLENT